VFRLHGFWTQLIYKAEFISEEQIQEAGNYYSYDFKPTG